LAKKKVSKKKVSKTNTTKKVTKTRKVTKKKTHTMKYFAMLIVAIAVIAIISMRWAGQNNGEPEVGVIIASVNGETVTMADYERELNRLPAELQEMLDEKTVLRQLIDKKLLYTESLAIEIDVDAEVSKILEDNGLNLTQLEETLVLQGVTLDELKEQLRVAAFLDQTLFLDLSVSDEEAQAYYDANEQYFISPETVSARHILVSNTNRTDEEAQARIEEVKLALDEDVERFCELVTEYSDDPGSLQSCGQYPAFTRESNYVQAFEDTAFVNEVDEYRIVKTQFGFHLIQTVAKTPEQPIQFFLIEEELKQNLLFEKQKEIFSIYIEELRNNAEVINCFESPDNEVCSATMFAEEQETEDEIVEEVGEESNLATFAQCLTDSGAKMYGAYWCSHCEAQKEAFGSAVEYIPYVECAIEDSRDQAAICAEAGIKGYPTWIIDGEQYSGVQTFEKLAQLTGCEL